LSGRKLLSDSTETDFAVIGHYNVENAAVRRLLRKFAIDFLTVPTATFRVLFVLVILSHDRRKIVHTNATEHPTAAWTAQQVLEAIGIDDTPKFLLRDNDAIFGKIFSRKVAALGLAEVTTALRSPWQNPYVERVIGSIRRECLNHTIVTGERHLRRVVANYVGYYNSVRTHMSLEKDAPQPRSIHGPNRGRIVRRRHCGGLHHEYRRKAASVSSNNIRRRPRTESCEVSDAWMNK